MSYAKHYAVLERHLSAMPDVPPVVFDNTPAYNGGGLFLEAVHLPAGTQTVDFCARLRYSGIFSINVFAPADKGAGESVRWADALVGYFHGADLDGLTCGQVEVARVGRVGVWFAVNVSVHWHSV